MITIFALIEFGILITFYGIIRKLQKENNMASATAVAAAQLIANLTNQVLALQGQEASQAATIAQDADDDSVLQAAITQSQTQLPTTTGSSTAGL